MVIQVEVPVQILRITIRVHAFVASVLIKASQATFRTSLGLNKELVIHIRNEAPFILFFPVKHGVVVQEICSGLKRIVLRLREGEDKITVSVLVLRGVEVRVMEVQREVEVVNMLLDEVSVLYQLEFKEPLLHIEQVFVVSSGPLNIISLSNTVRSTTETKHSQVQVQVIILVVLYVLISYIRVSSEVQVDVDLSLKLIIYIYCDLVPGVRVDF
mmetsp:Transcript_39314/g.40887  ORF Transcript_39314/g.40887 Transcript_39314/m.40887 type:complete len:214 (-) Transcript_39314:148-789(-)